MHGFPQRTTLNIQGIETYTHSFHIGIRLTICMCAIGFMDNTSSSTNSTFNYRFPDFGDASPCSRVRLLI